MHLAALCQMRSRLNVASLKGRMNVVGMYASRKLCVVTGNEIRETKYFLYGNRIGLLQGMEDTQYIMQRAEIRT